MVEILRDFLLADTPFRGLILRTEFCLCAYIGVPESHWMANMEELDFPCHRGLTFNAPGGDGLRPAGWYWYGWDYGHAGDRLQLPEALMSVMDDAMKNFFLGGKAWTAEEVELDLIDAAIALKAALSAAGGAPQLMQNISLAGKPRTPQ